jgi:NitT/TauT family transport system ATP-binding protein
VLDNVTAPLELCGIDPKTRESRGRMLLAAMELSSHERDRPGDLEEHLLPSISICRAMIHEPSILLLDEPFAELDPVQRERACTNLQLLWMKEPRTAVLATRSIQEAVHLSDLVVVLAPRLGARAPRIEIDLPRPRRFDKLMTPAMAEYGNQIRNILHAEGALP